MSCLFFGASHATQHCVLRSPIELGSIKVHSQLVTRITDCTWATLLSIHDIADAHPLSESAGRILIDSSEFVTQMRRIAKFQFDHNVLIRYILPSQLQRQTASKLSNPCCRRLIQILFESTLKLP